MRQPDDMRRLRWGVLAGVAAVLILLALGATTGHRANAPVVGAGGATPSTTTSPVPGGATPDLARLSLRMGLALGAIVVLILAMAAVFQWTGKRRGIRTSSSLEVLECCPLAAKRALYSIRAGERVVVLGVTEASIAAVLELTPEEGRALYPAGAGGGRGTGFLGILRDVTSRAGGP